MEVQIRLFAGLRQRAGADELTLELPDGACVADALERLEWLTDGQRVVMAVNRDYAGPDVVLVPDDELALIPPVSGGSGTGSEGAGGERESPAAAERESPADGIHARVTDGPLSLDALLERVRDPRAGAIVTFQGVTRDVPSLHYEAYAEMAQEKLAEIVAAAIARHGLCAAAAEHRIGTVPLSEPSVIVAASAPHRAEAFAGARELIDEIKAQAPIWKKEEGEWKGGSVPGEGRQR
jgi:MoaE-MoaD fusion protein